MSIDDSIQDSRTFQFTPVSGWNPDEDIILLDDAPETTPAARPPRMPRKQTHLPLGPIPYITSTLSAIGGLAAAYKTVLLQQTHNPEAACFGIVAAGAFSLSFLAIAGARDIMKYTAASALIEERHGK